MNGHPSIIDAKLLQFAHRYPGFCEAVHHHSKCVHNSVASDMNMLLSMALCQQILTVQFGRCKMETSSQGRNSPIELLRKWRRQIIGSQSSLNMSNSYGKRETSDGGGHRRRCITMHQHKIRLVDRKHISRKPTCTAVSDVTISCPAFIIFKL